MAAVDNLEKALLAAVGSAAGGVVPDSAELAARLGCDHKALVGCMKSLLSYDMIQAEDINHSRLVLTKEAEDYLGKGSPEVQLFNAITPDGVPMASLKASLGKAGDVGFKQAMQQKWIKLDKSGGEAMVHRAVESVTDSVLQQLETVAAGGDLPQSDVANLKKRKLVTPETWKTYRLSKGEKFALERKKAATDLTYELLSNGAWKGETFKEYNFSAMGILPPGGHLHPLLKVRTQFKKIFTQMGFEEMPTNNFVESSFWNFDALFQPQQHPARDAHDTFFLTKPATTPINQMPEDYTARVKTTHESGGYGSVGYGYNWKTSEAEKNLLRTHTTAVSSKMLYKLAQEGFRPAKYFSIDRVFRNEAVDRTHLAEFHQIEGLVCDKGLTLGDLIGTLEEFFTRLGLPKLRFKPAYNPYTEPSMEIFSYSEELGKWMEVGNSGMFRPEMLEPMGLPEDVTVIAWGLSLERPTMILYGIDNIRDLFGHKVSLNVVKKNPICRLGL
eukprot:CAMPEP_0117651996 /NCGR_PEP_ID=MMETSP0804-20121206/2392_1 /TAXON_ID=1074897 /ORGANISM="Tetraselmis astigmatica, Strain CCMP880" /LENGTH=499 /DNA_ID=CAMNT_0005458015 /DNA_START=57 /DNA_END=1556 /DNA_ORIENTATION=-